MVSEQVMMPVSRFPFPIQVNVSSFISIKLNEENFLLWKQLMLQFLQCQGLDGFILGEIEVPAKFVKEKEGDEEIDVRNSEFDAWLRTDSLIRSWICSTLSDEVLCYTIELSTASQIWSMLVNRFTEKTIAKEFELSAKFQDVNKDGKTLEVIDYKTQQSRLFPLLASAYAFRFVSEWLNWLYTDVTQRLQAYDFSSLPEVHACTAGLKSLTTTIAADGIEQCRRLCGGHGYLWSSGLPELFAVYVPACTYEGDNVVLLLQVARFLMKTVSQTMSGKKPVGTVAYMARAKHFMQWNCDVQRAEDWLNPNVVLEAFEARAIRMSIACAEDLSKFDNPEDGFSELSPNLVEAALAHCQLIVVSKYIEKLEQDIPGKGVKQQLENLFYIYALHLVSKHLGDFLTTRSISSKQANLASEQLRSLYSQVRPNAVTLVDAFNHTDHYLGSVLGRYDGNVYPKLVEEAWKDPLNDTVVPDGYHEYIRPLLKQQLRTARL